ncbi:hypothetical protein [Pseudomonas sp. S1(2024)]|uniref:hypothetical protein n=1 Tax=Pseudomonas sp. S1(2024) TaxID=3390191 RepID=UPI0039784F34
MSSSIEPALDETGFFSQEHGCDWRTVLLQEISQRREDGQVQPRIPESMLRAYFWPDGLSYLQFKTLILDERFDWLSILATDHVGGKERSMLSFLMSRILFSDHLAYDPVIGESLRKRYNPDQIALIFSSAACVPCMMGSLGGGIDERNIALERIACILSEDQPTLDAWITLMLRSINSRFPALGKSLSSGKRINQAFQTTAAFESLAQIDESCAMERNASLLTLMCVAAFLSVFEPEPVKASLARFTNATMYHLADTEITGLFDINGNLVHRAFAQGLYLNAGDAQPFARTHLKNDPLRERNVELCGVLLACAPYMSRQPYSIRALLDVAQGQSSGFSVFVRNHLFSWRFDLIDTLFKHRKMAPLRARLLTPEHVLSLYGDEMSRTSLSRPRVEGAKVLYGHLPVKLRQQVHEQILRRLARRTTLKDLQSRGSALTLLAYLSTPEQAQAMRTLVLPMLDALMARVTDQPDNPDAGRQLGDWQLRAALIDLHAKGILSASDYAPHIKSAKGLNTLARALSIDPVRLIEHAKPSVRSECLETDIGL